MSELDDVSLGRIFLMLVCLTGVGILAIGAVLWLGVSLGVIFAGVLGFLSG